MGKLGVATTRESYQNDRDDNKGPGKVETGTNKRELTTDGGPYKSEVCRVAVSLFSSSGFGCSP